jgi:hypothetical protein
MYHEDAVVSIDETYEDDIEYVVKESGEQVALDGGSAESREHNSQLPIYLSFGMAGSSSTQRTKSPTIRYVCV